MARRQNVDNLTLCVTSAGGAADPLKTRCYGSSILAGVVTVCLSAFPACTNAQATTISGSAEIVDGDTLRLGPVTIRIHGIDAPESDQDCAGRNGGRWRCGNAATKAMTRLADGRQIECSPTDRDAYGRIVAICDVEGVDLGGSLVASGLAWAFRRYSDDYVDAEADARHRGVGIWQAETQTAWDFRSDGWARASASAPREGCPIKGNIARDGERIYHTPWSSSYSRTKIDESKGERWFCDEAEAVAAGWRAPRSR